MLFIASNEWLMCVGGGVSSELDMITAYESGCSCVNSCIPFGA